jgi:hypothetical protein
MSIIITSLVCFRLWCLTPLSTIFNYISWRSILLVEETGVHGENHRPVASHWHNLSHNVVSSTPHHERRSNRQGQWWRTSIAYVVVNPTTIRPRPRWAPIYVVVLLFTYNRSPCLEWSLVTVARPHFLFISIISLFFCGKLNSHTKTHFLCFIYMIYCL